MFQENQLSAPAPCLVTEVPWCFRETCCLHRHTGTVPCDTSVPTFQGNLPPPSLKWKQQITRRHIPEGSNLDVHRCENVKLHRVPLVAAKHSTVTRSQHEITKCKRYLQTHYLRACGGKKKRQKSTTLLWKDANGFRGFLQANALTQPSIMSLILSASLFTIISASTLHYAFSYWKGTQTTKKKGHGTRKNMNPRSFFLTSWCASLVAEPRAKSVMSADHIQPPNPSNIRHEEVFLVLEVVYKSKMLITDNSEYETLFFFYENSLTNLNPYHFQYWEMT